MIGEYDSSKFLSCSVCDKKLVPGGAYTNHVRNCTGQKKTRKRSRYREIFFANNGPGPYECHFCSQEVEFDLVIVHHLDHSHINNDLENLVAAHHECHTGHHLSEQWADARSRKKIRAEGSLTRGHRRPHSPETKEKLRQASLQRWAEKRTKDLLASGEETNVTP